MSATEYSFRKVFWDEISELIRAGYTTDRAYNPVYKAYGHNIGLTNILQRMHVDRKVRL